MGLFYLEEKWSSLNEGEREGNGFNDDYFRRQPQSFAHKLGSIGNLELTRLVRPYDSEAESCGFESPRESTYVTL